MNNIKSIKTTIETLKNRESVKYGFHIILICISLLIWASDLRAESSVIKKSQNKMAEQNSLLKVADSKRLNQYLENILNTDLPRNYQNPAQLNRVANGLISQMQQFGIACKEQKYSVNNQEYKNVICPLNIQAKNKIIVGAHYDVYGEYIGADDNASGVAGVLETARILSQNKNKLKSNIDFVFYTLEEPPFFRTENMGSAVHARSILNEKDQISAVYILEMIGYFDEKNSQDYPMGLGLFYPKHGNYIAAVANFSSRNLSGSYCQMMKQLKQIDCQKLTAPSFIQGVDFSDHLNYWQYDIPAIMITDTAFFRNKNYHTSADQAQTLNTEKMAQVVNGLANTLLK
ncbi:MAG: M20/M25/M40 family metallo-hydrolase [Acinetobacter gerneri]|jgi:hypothetical protein|nr:M28 family peptidase [Acinetobacter gerneri]MCH4243484.1 M20/M25/M40 family metallo-hydrolase [Acinetobacter gerneri]